MTNNVLLSIMTQMWLDRWLNFAISVSLELEFLMLNSYRSYSTFKVYDAAISSWHALIDSKCNFTFWYPSYWRELWGCLPLRAPRASYWDLPPVLYTLCLCSFESLGWLSVRAVFLLVSGSANSTGLLNVPSHCPVELQQLWGNPMEQMQIFCEVLVFISNSFGTEESRSRLYPGNLFSALVSPRCCLEI